MRNAIVLVTLLLVSGFVLGAVACNEGDVIEPTSTLEPSPVPTSSPDLTSPTPQAIDWAAIATRISQLASDSGLTIYEVQQLTEDIVEVAIEGNCTDFAGLLDNEPDLMLLGKPQLDPHGICTMWFRVLASP
jgi:hypothetical protein